MNDGYLTAMAALAGSAIGALASLGTTWLTNKRSLCPVGAMNS
jgi:hypothetical protein